MKIKLFVEVDKEGDYWGRCTVNNNLITDVVSVSVEQLEQSMKTVIEEFEGIPESEIDFEVVKENF